MDLYDIHTHDAITASAEDDGVPRQSLHYILNVYPLGFEYAKDSELCPWFSCGVHPWYSEDADPQLNFLSEIANDPRIVAIGETGIDKLKGPALDIQEKVFARQIELSERLHKPLIIHCVKAWDELLQIKKLHKPHQPWIIHGYRGKTELTKQLLSHGLYFSIGEKFNADAIKEIPLDRLFTETDTSEMPLYEIYENIANTIELPLEVLGEQIQLNIRNIFRIPVVGTAKAV